MYYSTAHANIHNSLLGARYATHRNLDQFALNEANKRIRLLNRADGYRCSYNRAASDQVRGAKATPILTKNKYPSLATLQVQGSEQVEPEKFAPQRWINCEAIQHPLGRIARINIHPNATVMNRRPGAPIVEEYNEFMVSLTHLLTFLHDERFRIVLSGDLNFRRGARSAGYLDPYEVFTKFPLTSKAFGIDAMVWSRNLKPVRIDRISRETIDSDHPGIFAVFEKVAKAA